ncbi:MAG: aromatic ring-hydroxylating oxygenase subunit alpha [Phenylobacterium sp.]
MTPDPARRLYGSVSTTPEGARALPGRVYSDPLVLEAERRAVMRAGWLPIARLDQLAANGDFVCADAAGEPVIAVRGADGVLRVLSSVCRHRGLPLASGAGQVHVLTCPYHLWRYGLDGRLLSAPAMQGSEIFERSDCRLPEFRSEAWGGFLLVNLDGAAEPLAPALLPLAARLSPMGPETLVTVDRIELDSPWNWKIMVENFLESYHHIGPHSQTLQATHPGLGTFEGDGSDAFTLLENPPGDPAGNGFIVAGVFPLGLLYLSEDPEPTGVWYQLDRLQPESFRLTIHLLASPALAALPGFAEEMRGAVLKVHAEDIPMCEGLQAGVAAGAYAPGPLSPLERPLWRFHRHLAMRLAGD